MHKAQFWVCALSAGVGKTVGSSVHSDSEVSLHSVVLPPLTNDLLDL